MPRLVDYATVFQTATANGLRCAYPNGAAFVLNTDPRHVAAWSATADDATIVPAMRPRVRRVARERMARLAACAWRELFGGAGEAWLAPAHHWAAALEHGDGQWLAPLLAELGIDAAPLRDRTRADAVAFGASESHLFERTLEGILDNLWRSDFSMLLPGEAVVCTVHHHKQLWWQCGDANVAELLLEMTTKQTRPKDQ